MGGQIFNPHPPSHKKLGGHIEGLAGPNFKKCWGVLSSHKMMMLHQTNIQELPPQGMLRGCPSQERAHLHCSCLCFIQQPLCGDSFFWRLWRRPTRPQNAPPHGAKGGQCLDTHPPRTSKPIHPPLPVGQTLGTSLGGKGGGAVRWGGGGRQGGLKRSGGDPPLHSRPSSPISSTAVFGAFATVLLSSLPKRGAGGD